MTVRELIVLLESYGDPDMIVTVSGYGCGSTFVSPLTENDFELRKSDEEDSININCEWN